MYDGCAGDESVKVTDGSTLRTQLADQSTVRLAYGDGHVQEFQILKYAPGLPIFRPLLLGGISPFEQLCGVDGRCSERLVIFCIVLEFLFGGRVLPEKVDEEGGVQANQKSICLELRDVSGSSPPAISQVYRPARCWALWTLCTLEGCLWPSSLSISG